MKTEINSQTPAETDKQDSRRAQILDGAAKCFAKYGFHGASMAQISKSAGMSVGHIYHYYDSKTALIAAIVERERAHMREKLLEIDSIPAEQFIADLVRHSTESLIREADPFQTVLNLEILAECQRNPEIGKIVQAQDEELRLRIGNLIRKNLGITDFEGRTEVLFALLNGLPGRAVRHPDIDVKNTSTYIEKAIRDLFS